jgi:hypothetical protein
MFRKRLKKLDFLLQMVCNQERGQAQEGGRDEGQAYLK